MNYVPVRVSTLRGDQKIDFDLYIRIASKDILYIRKGDSFEGDRLVRLKAKKLKKMFILPEEEEKYREYLARNIEMAYDNNSGKSMEDRSQIVQGAQQSNAEEVMENPEDEGAYNMAKEGAGRYVDFLLKNEDALASMLNIKNTDHSIAHHGVTVSTIAAALARRLKLFDEAQLGLLTLGSLLHDLGHIGSDLNISRPLSEFSEAELAEYKNHSTTGGDRAKDKKHFDSQVLNIIHQHEETINGSGFPQGLEEKSMDPMAIVVATANAFDRFVTFEGMEKGEAAKKMMIDCVGKYPLDYLQNLSKIVKDLK